MMRVYMCIIYGLLSKLLVHFVYIYIYTYNILRHLLFRDTRKGPNFGNLQNMSIEYVGYSILKLVILTSLLVRAPLESTLFGLNGGLPDGAAGR